MTIKRSKSLSRSPQTVNNAAANRKTAKSKASSSEGNKPALSKMDWITRQQLDIIAFDNGLSKGALYRDLE